VRCIHVPSPSPFQVFCSAFHLSGHSSCRSFDCVSPPPLVCRPAFLFLLIRLRFSSSFGMPVGAHALLPGLSAPQSQQSPPQALQHVPGQPCACVCRAALASTPVIVHRETRRGAAERDAEALVRIKTRRVRMKTHIARREAAHVSRHIQSTRGACSV